MVLKVTITVNTILCIIEFKINNLLLNELIYQVKLT
jgi:hypothetical protein